MFLYYHIPPFSGGFNKKKQNKYAELMRKYNVSYSIHGHVHIIYQGNYYSDNVKYVLIDNIKDHNFFVVRVNKNKVDFELKTFVGYHFNKTHYLKCKNSNNKTIYLVLDRRAAFFKEELIAYAQKV